MSKVYIEGFKMPKSCRECKFFTDYEEFGFCSVELFTIYREQEGRCVICPLREVRE